VIISILELHFVQTCNILIKSHIKTKIIEFLQNIACVVDVTVSDQVALRFTRLAVCSHFMPIITQWLVFFADIAKHLICFPVRYQAAIFSFHWLMGYLSGVFNEPCSIIQDFTFYLPQITMVCITTEWVCMNGSTTDVAHSSEVSFSNHLGLRNAKA
jgi:hypothetical protein